jgi:hypothetical protein
MEQVGSDHRCIDRLIALPIMEVVTMVARAGREVITGIT